VVGVVQLILVDYATKYFLFEEFNTINNEKKIKNNLIGGKYRESENS